jgi:3-deoxy-7-phosphoheptulonate synthase
MAAVGSPELLIVMGAQASDEQVDEVVARLEEAGASAHVSRGREATVIGAIEALELLAEARAETGLPLVTELMDPRDVEAVVEIADVIQIGARNMQNFNLLSEVGRSPKPVLLKRGPSASIEELLMAAEYVVKEGNAEVILCERGIKTFERSTRYTLDLSAIPVLKHETHLPVIVDPSHAAGKRDLVLPLARAAVAAGADGIIVEVHPRPEEALCDGPQQIPAAEFADFAHEIRALASLLGKTIG